MTDKVVGLDGAPVQQPQFDAGVLSIIEDIYEQAKAGKVVGIAVVLMADEAGSGFSVSCSYHGAKISLLGGVARLVHKLNKDMDGD